MAKLNLEEVQIIAELAKLTLSQVEKLMFQEQLSAILDYAEMLQQVDTTGIPPTASAIPLKNVMRPDQVNLSLPTESCTYRRRGDYILSTPQMVICCGSIRQKCL